MRELVQLYGYVDVVWGYGPCDGSFEGPCDGHSYFPSDGNRGFFKVPRGVTFKFRFLRWSPTVSANSLYEFVVG